MAISNLETIIDNIEQMIDNVRPDNRGRIMLPKDTLRQLMGELKTSIPDEIKRYNEKTRELEQSKNKVVIIDDLIATGGTIEAITEMVESLGGEVVKIEFVMELAGLKGRERLSKYDIDSLLIYDGK
mgnify:CR=1 FL=1